MKIRIIIQVLILVCFVHFVSATTERVVTGFSEGYAKVKVDGKWGFINHRGQLVIKPFFDSASDFQGGYSHVEREGKKTLIDTQGNVVIGKPFLTQGYYQYSPLKHFWVSDDGKTAKWGFKDSAGNIIIKPQYDSAYTFSEGLARIGIGEYPNAMYGFVDTLGQTIIEPQYELVGDFKEGVAKVAQNGRHFFIKKNGEKIGKQDFRFVFEFSEGLAAVNAEQEAQLRSLNSVTNGRWGYIDHKGDFVIEPIFQQARSFKNGLAQAKQNNLWGMINRNGDFVIQPQYRRIIRGTDHILEIEEPKMGRKGFIDINGNIIVEPTLFFTRDFSEGLCAVTRAPREKWGYINIRGEMVIEPKFDNAWDFSEGFAPVSIGDKWGYIDRTGNFLWEPTK